MRLADKLLKRGGRYALITDSNVESVMGKKIVDELRAAGVDISLFSFPAGEKNKTREAKAELEDALLDAKYGRECTIVALGGGVVTDLAGFIASTFCRGVPLISVPTTLLGMVDASIGGKTGVNTARGKNLIGAFYPAESIHLDISMLETLPENEWKNGIAEVIKYGAIASPQLLTLLEEGVERWEAKDETFLQEIITRSIQIKEMIVEQDSEDRGLREVLNFGHTIGHALETAMDYQLGHGEAVAIGMVAECYIAEQMGELKREDLERLATLLTRYGFSLRIPEGCSWERFRAALIHDKKNKEGKVRSVILQKMGKPTQQICKEVSEEDLEGAWQWLNIE